MKYTVYFLTKGGENQGYIRSLSPRRVSVTYFSWLSGEENGSKTLPIGDLAGMDLFTNYSEFLTAANQAGKKIYEGRG